MLGGVRFILRPPAAHASGLLQLPWERPLEEWGDEHLIKVAHRASPGYRLLGELEAMGMPAVSVLGICVERPPVDGMPQDAVLVTRFLDYSMSYRYVFSHGHASGPPTSPMSTMPARAGPAANPAG